MIFIIENNKIVIDNVEFDIEKINYFKVDKSKEIDGAYGVFLSYNKKYIEFPCSQELDRSFAEKNLFNLTNEINLANEQEIDKPYLTKIEDCLYLNTFNIEDVKKIKQLLAKKFEITFMDDQKLTIRDNERTKYALIGSLNSSKIVKSIDKYLNI